MTVKMVDISWKVEHIRQQQFKC